MDVIHAAVLIVATILLFMMVLAVFGIVNPSSALEYLLGITQVVIR